MVLDARIPLLGNPSDVPGAFQRGLRFADEARQFQERRENAPLRRQAAEQAVELGDLKIAAADRGRELFEARRGLALIKRAETPELWDQTAATVAPGLVGQFDRREELGAAFQTMVEALDPSTPDKPRFYPGKNGEVNQILPDPNDPGGFTFKNIIPAKDPAPKEIKPSRMDQEVAGLVASGVPLQMAQGIAAGRFKVVGDPARIVDVSTGEIVGDAPPDLASAGPGIAREDTLFAQAPSATGLYSSLLSLFADVPGQLPGVVGEFFVNEKVVKARQDFATSTQSMLQAFVVNSKFPVAEVNRIKDEIGAVAGAFTSANAMEIRLRSLESSLLRNATVQEQTASDPRLPSKERAGAAANARAMRQFINLIGVPREEEIEDLRDPGPVGDAQAAEPQEPPPQSAVNDGVTPNQWQLMTPEERALWQN